MALLFAKSSRYFYKKELFSCFLFSFSHVYRQTFITFAPILQIEK
ncbi:hypothetical protein PRABACTJOHN_00902 [Parabacteroides johnsonii DSM 18315]|uniref:Uncharacterized protein n=1 Tax=Parabacteroides johnsonii DSM 18315 TaxID=537006 RepID=B7B7A5_9BACT|nr:hypothetical protein PRABACTJOHN_00902 [Parabacteroides johnsonii DSM 18315]